MCINQIKIYTKDNKVFAATPYSAGFISRARKIGGKWDGTANAWTFDERDLDRVREICIEVYGTDNLTPGIELVNVRINLDLFKQDGDESIFLFGRTIVERKYRDYSVKFSDGVILISGGFPSSGGSAKYPSLSQQSGTVLEIRDVPEGIAKIRQEKYGADALEILPNTKKVNIQVLKDEAIAIRKRLAEILEILAKEGEQT